MIKRILILMLFVLTLAIPQSSSAVQVQTRFDLINPATGAKIPCGATASGVSVVLLKGYATGTGAPRFRVGYGPAGSQNAESWYGVDPSLVSAQEKLVADVAQDLIPGNGTHMFAFGAVTGLQHCAVTFNNIPSPSTGETTGRPLALDPVDGLRILLFTYKTNVPIPCGSMAQTGRIRAEIQAKNVNGGYHAIHTHQELPPSKGGNGPDQDGDGYDRRFWEKAAFDVWVPGGSVWTTVNTTLVAGTGPGNNTFHAAEGHVSTGGIETFCSYNSASSTETIMR